MTSVLPTNTHCSKEISSFRSSNFSESIFQHAFFIFQITKCQCNQAFIGFFYMCDATTSGFNPLIPAPNVPSLVSTEPVELLCKASNIRTTDPFCFVKQKQETVEVFLLFFLQICAAPSSVRRTKIHGDKGCPEAIITIKQGNQHAVPNRNPKRNQAETTNLYSFHHVYLLTRIVKIHAVTTYI